jgi:hypothetical protein
MVSKSKKKNLYVRTESVSSSEDSIIFVKSLYDNECIHSDHNIFQHVLGCVWLGCGFEKSCCGL